MIKMKKKINSFKKKPYKVISGITVIIFLVGLISFNLIKSNQIKGMIGIADPSSPDTKALILRGRVPYDQSNPESFFKNTVAEASEVDLKGMKINHIPYRLSVYGTETATDIDDGKVIDGQFGFVPKWTELKTKVILYDETGNGTILNQQKKDTDGKLVDSKEGIIHREGTIVDKTLGDKIDSENLVYVFDKNDIGKKYLKFTHMGTYKGKTVDIIVRPENVEEGKAFAVGISSIRSTEAEGTVLAGSYLSISATNSYSKDRTKAEIRSTEFISSVPLRAVSNDISAYTGNATSAGATGSLRKNKESYNSSYAEVSFNYYYNDEAKGNGELDPVKPANKASIKGLYTYGDFDNNESVGVDANAVETLYVNRPDVTDIGKFNLNQNQMFMKPVDAKGKVYDYSGADFPSVGLTKTGVNNPNNYASTEGDKLLNQDGTTGGLSDSTNLKTFGYDLTEFYGNPNDSDSADVPITYAQAKQDYIKSGDAKKSFRWLHYFIQRLGFTNNAYTQLLYAYPNSDNEVKESSYVYFNRAYQENTDTNVVGNWLSFTYRETDSLKLSINASASPMWTSTQTNMVDDWSFKAGFNPGEKPYVQLIRGNVKGPNDTLLTKNYSNTPALDNNSASFYIADRVIGDLGYGRLSEPYNNKATIEKSAQYLVDKYNYGAGVPRYSWRWFGNTNNSNTDKTIPNTGMTFSYQPGTGLAAGSVIGYISRTMLPVLLQDPIKTAKVNGDHVEWTIIQSIPPKFRTLDAESGGAITFEDELPSFMVLDTNTAADISIKGDNNENSPLFKIDEPVLDTTTNRTTIRIHLASNLSTEQMDELYVSNYTITFQTKIDPRILDSNDQSTATNALRDEFMEKYYKEDYKYDTVTPDADGAAIDVKNSIDNRLLIQNIMKVHTKKIDLDDRTMFSMPEFGFSSIKWSDFYNETTKEHDVPSKYYTPAELDFTPSITITKTGEAKANPSGTDFKGAEFTVREVVYDQADNVVSDFPLTATADSTDPLKFVTGDNGTVTIKDQEFYIDGKLGKLRWKTKKTQVAEGATSVPDQKRKYIIQEVTAPSGYDVDATPQTVEISGPIDHPVEFQNELTRASGTLAVKKEVFKASDNTVADTDVDRGDLLYYVITIQNTDSATDLTRISNWKLEDSKLNNSYISFNVNDVMMTDVENLGVAESGATAFKNPLPTGSFDTNKNLSLTGAALDQSKQIRVKIPFKVRDDSPSGLFDNIATVSITGQTGDPLAAKVENRVKDLTKQLYISQVILEPSNQIVVPEYGYVQIENLVTSATPQRGSGEVSNVRVPSGTSAKYKSVFVPYSTTNRSYFISINLPQMYSLVGYDLRDDDKSVKETVPSLDPSFDLDDVSAPKYLTIYIKPSSISTVPFYNWSYADNSFGLIKKAP